MSMECPLQCQWHYQRTRERPQSTKSAFSKANISQFAFLQSLPIWTRKRGAMFAMRLGNRFLAKWKSTWEKETKEWKRRICIRLNGNLPSETRKWFHRHLHVWVSWAYWKTCENIVFVIDVGLAKLSFQGFTRTLYFENKGLSLSRPLSFQ